MKPKKPAQKPPAAKAGGKRVRRPYKPQTPVERLDTMISAVRTHAMCRSPIDRALAVEIYWELVRLRYGPAKKPRADPANLRSAALAKTMIDIFDCPWEEAIPAAFPNPNGADPESLRRNYVKLCKHLVAGSYDAAAAWPLYEGTAHYKKRSGPI